MSSYEYFNQRVDERTAAAVNRQQKKPLQRALHILAPVICALLAFVLLEAVGFISTEFCMILSVIVLCVGSCHFGRIWDQIFGR